MRTLAQKYLGGQSIQEDSYKVDLAVLERYQAFSNEILRLALLGMAGYGFLISNIALSTSKSGEYAFLPLITLNKGLLTVGVIALALAAATALGHRYFSTDCLTHFVRRVRLSQSIEGMPETAEKLTAEQIIKHEEISLDRDLWWCKWLLLASCLLLVVGAACVAFAFSALLFSVPGQK